MTMQQNQKHGRVIGRYTCLALTLVAAFIAGSLVQPITAIQAQARFSDVQASQQQPAFQSGGARSVPVLDEILVTLRCMDARLQRLETKVCDTPSR